MTLIQQNGAYEFIISLYLPVFVIAFARPMYDILKCVEITG